jgi:hypothetical protein
VCAADAEAGRGGEGDDGADRDAADGAELPHAELLLAGLPAAKTEEYSHTAVNKFNVNPESIPDWLFDFMPTRGGYFVGNVSPARMDFRWFALGNCVAILASLATPDQAAAIMDLIEERWEDLVGEMPRWSYHNGGSWPGQ